MAYQTVPLGKFKETFGTEIELSSVALGGRIDSVSDEFFAEAANLIKVEPAPSLKGQFGPNGALYSGWESRRHNPTYDWCIIKLGASGSISGFDIDTSHFNGNEAPEVSVQALLNVKVTSPGADDPRWVTILSRVPLGPNSRHLFKINITTEVVNFVKLIMYPDGGIARFRVYGLIKAIFPENPEDIIDLAHAFSGGRVVFVSDQHFGVGSNLLLPGRGKDMGDGWETKRSRIKGHKDWVIIKLGAPGCFSKAEIDTAHFKGNFPESCELHAIFSEEVVPQVDESVWARILPGTRLKPDSQHFFDLENVKGQIYSHVRVTIYPDGGIKRVRILGKRKPHPFEKGVETEKANSAFDTKGQIKPQILVDGSTPLIATPLTSESFAAYGQVVQAFSSPEEAPEGIKVTPANQGSARKFHKLAPVVSSYPSDIKGATSALSVYRCSPLEFDFHKDYVGSGPGWAVKLLERHSYTNQAFIPMGVGNSDILLECCAKERTGRAYLVIVALNGEDDRPNLATLHAFLAGSDQGVVYSTGTWHHPMIALDTTMDFTCVETQVGDGSKADCEIVTLNNAAGYPRVKIKTH